MTSIITLLPVLYGLFLWNQLPDSVATHLDLDNQPDGYSSKAFAVFGLPLILLLHSFSMCGRQQALIPNQKILIKKYSGFSYGSARWFPCLSLHNLRIQFRI
ncbi:MAG: DUF1648 domain-containing protein [Lachnospiraceae bacterium]